MFDMKRDLYETATIMAASLTRTAPAHELMIKDTLKELRIHHKKAFGAASRRDIDPLLDELLSTSAVYERYIYFWEPGVESKVRRIDVADHSSRYSSGDMYLRFLLERPLERIKSLSKWALQLLEVAPHNKRAKVLRVAAVYGDLAGSTLR